MSKIKKDIEERQTFMNTYQQKSTRNVSSSQQLTSFNTTFYKNKINRQSTGVFSKLIESYGTSTPMKSARSKNILNSRNYTIGEE